MQGEGGGGLRELQPPLWKVFKLVWLPMSIPLFIPKIILQGNYNISSNLIDHYKKIVAIPLLDSSIIQMQD